MAGRPTAAVPTGSRVAGVGGHLRFHRALGAARAYGREGAEELTVLLNQCFGGMIEIIDDFGGDVLKFGGDALLVLSPAPNTRPERPRLLQDAR